MEYHASLGRSMALQQGIDVMLRGGATTVVIPEVIIGDFAVHNWLWGARAVGPGFTVTHVASGLALWTVRHLSDAVKVAQWLDKRKVVPVDAVTWKENLSGQARSKLIVDLTAIAQRFVPAYAQ